MGIFLSYMIVPAYRDGSVVNLMSSVLRSYGVRSNYNPLSLLTTRELKESRTTILLVIDGLGYEYLRGYPDSFLFQHTRGALTTVFPSTTAACVTTFFTGLAPQQHAIVGWFTYMKELGQVVVPLRFASRGGATLDNVVNPQSVFHLRSVFDCVGVRSYTIHPQDIKDSPYNIAFRGKAHPLGYSSLAGLFWQLKKLAGMRGRKFVYAYWPTLDSLSHKKGFSHRSVRRHFLELDKAVRAFASHISGMDVSLIVTADHGQVETRASERILLSDHPALAETLALPLSGDSRAAYCYVRPHKLKQFKKYVGERLGRMCRLVPSEELIRRGYFGAGKQGPRLNERVGDYVLLMKGNYIIRDFVAGEREHYHIGNHGGLSRKEMLVPLIVIKG